MDSMQAKYIKRGEYVKRKEGAKSVFIRGEYCRATKRYSLVDTEDLSREVWVKADTVLFINFDY